MSPRKRIGAAFAALVLALTGIVIATSPGVQATNKTLPITAAFYYPWFPETWHSNPNDQHYPPTLGKYDSSNRTIARTHMEALRYGGVQAVISSWWGVGTPTDTRATVVLDTAYQAGLDTTFYYEKEGTANPTVAEIQTDLARLQTLADTKPGYLKVGNKPVLFVYNADDTSCSVVDKWKTAAPNWYLQLKVFDGYEACANQPDSWHQYGPASAYEQHGTQSAHVSPGFWKHDEATARLVRDRPRWKYNLSQLADSATDWRLIETFNEWGEGSAVEPAAEWQSSGGFGQYIDDMRSVLVGNQRFPNPTPPPPTTTVPPPPPAASTAVTIAAAGDSSCPASRTRTTNECADHLTGDVIEAMNPDLVLAPGDLQYETGLLSDFQGAYGVHWGAFKNKTYPIPGNHEWSTANAQGYRDFFATGVPAAVDVTGEMYYSFDQNGWHFINIDSNCAKHDGCQNGDAQTEWIKADLLANNGKPTIVQFHHPRWSSGRHGSTASMATTWNLFVADKDVQLALTGHDHSYERFAPMGTAGPDPAGLRQIVVGMGGRSHYCDFVAVPGTEVFDCTTHGVLKLELKTDGSLAWQFVAAAGTGTFTDSGTQARRQ